MSALAESSPEVGSSRKSSTGSWTISAPMDTRRRSPPDTPRWDSSPMMVDAAGRSPSWSIRARTRARFFSRGSDRGSRNSAAKVSVSSTVSMGKRRSSCITYAEMDRRSRPLTRSPFRVTDPPRRRRGMRFASASISVDLPLPLAPMIARISPSRASPDTASSSVRCPSARARSSRGHRLPARTR
ncbi:uncharacterized protein LOC109722227 [Ananas comosus]|uniref:Uncharacterized protein LOC109722227 n=1 Tax=Ananas comosus TaxID=4615 RepID=A0A6P5GI60_ANACO|nr:uncharacterized protein LOC109722227 [Ananas comosus]